jgi:acetylornithine deacetylase/succinyl-diaminopimelate desuccinylase-like protein
MSSREALNRFTRSESDYLGDLAELVRIPSVSFPGFDPAPVRQCAEATARLLRRRNLQNVELVELAGAHPGVYGEHCALPGAPTVLFYAHHDVQPAGDPASWTSPPFDPVVRNGRLYGRGAADDKAGIVVCTAAVDAWLSSTGSLPLNVKLIVDGEEEIGSEHFAELLALHGEKLRADAVVVMDSSNFDTGLPSVTTMLRGLVACEVEVRALEQPVHSGIWGGPIPDPTLALCGMLARLTHPDGTVALPGIADRVRLPTALERASIESLPGGKEEFRRQAGMLPGVELWGGTLNPWETVWRQPSLSVNALQASSRRDARNIVCDSAWARVGIRIVPDLEADDVSGRLVEALRASIPWGLECRITPEPAVPWWSTDTSHPAFRAAFRALERGFGRPAVVVGGGGSIPFVGPLVQHLGGAPALLLGVEDPQTRAHSNDESLCLDDWRKATRATICLLEELAEDKAS